MIRTNGWWLQIVGVTKDFNLASVRTPIHPFIFYNDKNAATMHVALHPNPGTWKKTIARIEEVCKKIYPNQDFDYTFFDKSIESLYQEDEQLSLLLDWSAGVAIFISCLGLLGLVIFMANSRRKEIATRKVLGATVAGIVALLSKDFMRLLLLGIIIASSDSLVANSQLVAKFCLPHWVKLVGFCIKRNSYGDSCVDDIMYKNCKDSQSKPCEKFKNGITQVLVVSQKIT